MSKLMQKIVLFFEPEERPYAKPSKLGHLLMNRLVIDEEENCEIVKIYELNQTFNYSIRTVTKRGTVNNIKDG